MICFADSSVCVAATSERTAVALVASARDMAAFVARN
jgi:hypothetical protein